jgi:hypothetical protein
MKTEDLIKYALIAVGGYLVWQYVVAPMMASSTATGTVAPPPAPTNTITAPNPGATNTNTSGSVTPATQVLPGWALAIQSQLTSAANGASMLTADQWNYYFNQITGFNVPANSMSGLYAATGGPGATMNVVTYLAGMASSGAYQAAQASGSSNGSGSGSGSSTGSGGGAVTGSSSLITALTAAANGATQLTADQWSYYYQQLPGKSAISPQAYGAMLAAVGATGSTVMSASAFQIMLATGGLSGIGDIIPVPGTGLGMSFTGPKIGRWGAALQRSSMKSGYVN